MSYTFIKDGVAQIDARNNVYYMAAGNSPAMMEKNVGQGSQYLWTYRDADGNYLDGAKNYRLHVPPDIPIKNFWSVVVYDALSRSELQNGQPFPSVSGYTDPAINADGSVDIAFGPEQPADGPELDRHRAWKRLVPDLPVLQPDRGLLRQDLAASGHHRSMTGGATAEVPAPVAGLKHRRFGTLVSTTFETKRPRPTPTGWVLPGRCDT